MFFRYPVACGGEFSLTVVIIFGNKTRSVESKHSHGDRGNEKTRVKKSVTTGGVTTNTYYMGDHFEVKVGASTEITKYIFAGNLRVAQVKNGVRSFFHKDQDRKSVV